MLNNLTVAELEANYMRGSALPDNPFLKIEWRGLLLTDSAWTEDIFNALSKAIETVCGDRIMYMVNYWFYMSENDRMEFKHKYPEEDIYWELEIYDYNSYMKMLEKNMATYRPAYVFSRCMRWGGIVEDRDYTVIGGDPQFMSLLEAELGGAANIKDDFVYFSGQWANGPHKDHLFKIISNIYGKND